MPPVYVVFKSNCALHMFFSSWVIFKLVKLWNVCSTHSILELHKQPGKSNYRVRLIYWYIGEMVYYALTTIIERWLDQWDFIFSGDDVLAGGAAVKGQLEGSYNFCDDHGGPQWAVAGSYNGDTVEYCHLWRHAYHLLPRSSCRYSGNTNLDTFYHSLWGMGYEKNPFPLKCSHAALSVNGETLEQVCKALYWLYWLHLTWWWWASLGASLIGNPGGPISAYWQTPSEILKVLPTDQPMDSPG